MRSYRLGALAAAAVLALAACGDDTDDAAPDAPEEPPTDPEPEPSDDPEAEPPDEPEIPDEIGSDEWTPLAEAPLELTEVGAAAFDGELWIIGGLTGGAQVTTATQIYDPTTDEWKDGPDLPSPVHHASLVATDAELVVIGGYRTLDFDPVDEVWVLDQEGGAWVEGPSLPEARGAGAGAWDGERLVYAGGIGPGGLADEVWELDDLEAGGWAEVGRLSIARDHLAATSDGESTVWFLGGREGNLDTNLGTVDVLSGDTLDRATDLPTPRGGVAAFFGDEHGACLAGGEQPASTFAEVECSQPDGTTTKLPSLSSARHGLGAAVIDGIAYVALGGLEPGLAVSGTLEALRLSDG